MREEINKQVIVKLIKSNRRRTLIKGWKAWEKRFLLAILALGFLGWSQGVLAQEYPTRPITLLICYAPGAPTDVCGRIIAQEATKILGQEIIPVNKPGGGGAVATGILANSKGDGYTLLAANGSPITNLPHMESVPYDPLKDLIPIFQFGFLNTAIIVRSDSPYKSFKDLVDFARKNPGKISFGSAGIGTDPHLAMEYVMLQEKVNINIIHFGGTSPAVTALLGGHVSAAGPSLSGFLSHLKAGTVRVLAVTYNKRIEAAPDAPTLSELGYHGAFTDIYLIAAPKGTPLAVVKKLENAFRNASETSEFKTVAKNFHVYAENPLSGQTLKEFIEERYAKNGDIIRKAKLGK